MDGWQRQRPTGAERGSLPAAPPRHPGERPPAPSAERWAPGWYPDPRSDAQLRWWDGEGWTPHVSPGSHPSPRTPSEARRPGGIGRLLARGATAKLLFSAAVVAVALLGGQQIAELVWEDDKVRLVFTTAAGDVDTADVEQGQAQLAERAAEVRTEVEAVATVPPAVASVDLTGMWTGESGLQYRIDEVDGMLSIEELSAFGTTASGYGFVEGNEVRFDYAAVDGSAGTAVLTIVDEGLLQGTFTNIAWGAVPATLRRH